MVPDDVRAYFESVPEDRRAALRALEALILGLYPDAEVLLWYGMPTYRKKRGWSNWVSIANKKQYISLYTNAHGHLDAFREAHPEVKTGKGCINLKPGAALPTEALREVIRHAMDEGE